MSEEVLKGCKKYRVERIITPSLYWVSEYGKGKCYKNELERFEYLLARNVEEYTDTEKILHGEIVAVGDKTSFRRGLVTDIFNRSNKTVFWILLMDYGNIIETNEDNIYFIKDKELMNQKLNAFDVIIQDIQPVVVEVKYGKNISDGIFQKRVCDDWSPAALQFVKDIIKNNPYVYVKSIYTDGRTIFGDIYVTQEPGGAFLSLSEKLCAKDFALCCDTTPKLNSPKDPKAVHGIERKIPNAALSDHTQSKKNGVRMGDLSESSDHITFPRQEMLSRVVTSKMSNKSYSSSSIISVSETKSFQPDTAHDESSNSYSLSWMLKKCQIGSSTSSYSCDSVKKGDVYESDENRPSKNYNVNISRVMQRSIELYNEQKHNERLNRN